MILHVHVPDEPSYEIGDEIWKQSLAVAIRSAAETIAARSQSSEPADQAHRAALLERIVAAMTCALVRVGDTYRAPDGVLCTLTAGPLELDPHRHKGRLASIDASLACPDHRGGPPVRGPSAWLARQPPGRRSLERRLGGRSVALVRR